MENIDNHNTEQAQHSNKNEMRSKKRLIIVIVVFVAMLALMFAISMYILPKLMKSGETQSPTPQVTMGEAQIAR